MKAYISVNEDGKIESIDSNPFSGFIEVETDDVMNLLNYKYVKGKLVELSDEEKEEFYPVNKEFEQEQKLQEMMAVNARTTFLVNLPDEEAIKIPLVFPKWDGNSKKYTKDDRCQYNGKLYKVLLDHTSQADWTPDTAVSLFVEIADPSIEYPDFKQPTGAHDAYNTGDKVTFNGKHYICKMDACTWSPSDYPAAWELVED